MPNARLYIEDHVEPAVALERAGAAWRSVDSDYPVAMYGATLRGEAWLLGAYQHAGQVLPGREPGSAGGAPAVVLRRATGGVAVRAGEGITYVALALRDRSSLMPCPRSRILNRNVRGALAGFRSAGITTHYFGRDFLSIDARPAVWVGWAARADGRVLIEYVICESNSCFLSPRELGYPVPTSEPFRGKEPWTLEQAVSTVVGSEKKEPVRGTSLIEHLAEGYGTGFKAAFEKSPIPPAWLTTEPRVGLPPDPDASALHWSHPIEEAIGFVSAGVSIDGAGKLARVRMCGDFYADDSCAITLERMLIGVAPNPDHIARAVDNAYGQAGHDVEGVRDLHTFQTAILDAVARARAA
ncbi:MAG TPA: hypothetical protein VFG30_11700 [Polyangiales bacterium]|nr:hypothetical protein [Polyangiales bacterium]